MAYYTLLGKTYKNTEYYMGYLIRNPNLNEVCLFALYSLYYP